MCWRCSPCFIPEQAGLTCAWEGSSDTSTSKGPINPGCAAALAPSIPKCSGLFSKFSAGFSCHSNFQHSNLCCFPKCRSGLVSASLGTQANAALCTIAHLHGNSSCLSCWWTSVVNFRVFSTTCCEISLLALGHSCSLWSKLLCSGSGTVKHFRDLWGHVVFSKNCYSIARRMRQEERQDRCHLILVLSWHKLYCNI